MLPCSGFFILKVVSYPMRRKLHLTVCKSAFLGKRYAVGGRNVSQCFDYRKNSILRVERNLSCMLIFTLVSALGKAYLKDMSSDVLYPFQHTGACQALEESLPVIVINCSDAAL